MTHGDPPGTRRRPALLEQWLGHVTQGDVAGLLGLYHPQARFEGFGESARGREEIADLLHVHARRLAATPVEEVRLLREDADRLTFETRFRSPMGGVALRHEWRLDGGAIGTHRVEARLDPADP